MKETWFVFLGFCCHQINANNKLIWAHNNVSFTVGALFSCESVEVIKKEENMSLLRINNICFWLLLFSLSGQMSELSLIFRQLHNIDHNYRWSLNLLHRIFSSDLCAIENKPLEEKRKHTAKDEMENNLLKRQRVQFEWFGKLNECWGKKECEWTENGCDNVIDHLDWCVDVKYHSINHVSAVVGCIQFFNWILASINRNCDSLQSILLSVIACGSGVFFSSFGW